MSSDEITISSPSDLSPFQEWLGSLHYAILTDLDAKFPWRLYRSGDSVDPLCIFGSMSLNIRLQKHAECDNGAGMIWEIACRFHSIDNLVLATCEPAAHGSTIIDYDIQPTARTIMGQPTQLFSWSMALGGGPVDGQGDSRINFTFFTAEFVRKLVKAEKPW